MLKESPDIILLGAKPPLKVSVTADVAAASTVIIVDGMLDKLNEAVTVVLDTVGVFGN